MQAQAVEKLEKIEGLCRYETHSKDEIAGMIKELTHKHKDTHEQYCTIEEYINCPPKVTFEYLANVYNLAEWTYSLRDFKLTETDGLYVSKDKIGDNTFIYYKVVANKEALTVDYHCAWDQSKELWMIYLMRVIPAQTVLNKPGSVVLWTNCHHPYYDENPYPEFAPPNRPWVGKFWNMFYGGHRIEMTNLKNILEYTHTCE